MIKGKIDVQGIRTYAHHGVYEMERLHGAWFQTDVVLHTSWDLPPTELEHTLNYELVVQVVREQMEEPRDLIESVCASILEQLQTLFATWCSCIEVCVHKPQVPINNVHEVSCTMRWESLKP